MLDLINGIPVHALVVHAVVVLLPLAVLGTLAIAVVPRWRQRYGWLVLAFAVVGTALVPVATSSGEALEERVGDPGEHAELGEQLLWFAIPLVVVLAVMLVLDRRGRAAEPTGGTTGGTTTGGTTGGTAGGTGGRGGGTAATVVTVVAVVVALANAVQVYRVGDSGAQAAWGGRVGSSQSAGDD